MERRAHWEEVYQRRRPDEVSWYQERPEFSLGLIRASGIAPDRPIIDIGGGASRLVDHLVAAGFRDLSVLDIAAAALAHSRQRLGPAADGVNWIVGDITAFRPERHYALWHDRAVFHFLTDPADRTRYLEVLQQGLAADGRGILATFALDGPEQCSGLPVERYDADKLCRTLGTEFVLLEQHSESHRTPAAKLQQFNYFVIARRGAAAALVS